MKRRGAATTPRGTTVREIYARPVIHKQYMGAANKFGGYTIPEAITHIDGISVERLAEEYGSPLFIFSENTLRRKIRELNQAFTSRYGSFQAAWSYKTNYLDAICNVFHSEGSWAEVVSAFEYLKARHNGIPGNKIIFNGPYKPYAVLKQAAFDGARIHVDHLGELADLKRIAAELRRSVEIALRINLDVGVTPQWSRFGFNLESGQALEAARMAVGKSAAGDGALKIVGVHCHIGTFMYETAPYKRAAQKMSEFFKVLRDELQQPMRYIDLGGGFASKNKLKAHYKADSSWLPTFDAYAEEITRVLYENFTGSELPRLFLETGRALVDEAGFLVTSVVGMKSLASGSRALILDAGVNLLYTSTWYDLNVAPTRQYSGAWEDVAIYGPLCMNIDVVRERCRLPNMHRGECLVIHPVGAYNITQSMQFIEMKPAVVLVTAEGKAKLIKRRESLEDLLALEIARNDDGPADASASS